MQEEFSRKCSCDLGKRLSICLSTKADFVAFKIPVLLKVGVAVSAAFMLDDCFLIR